MLSTASPLSLQMPTELVVIELLLVMFTVGTFDDRLNSINPIKFDVTVLVPVNDTVAVAELSVLKRNPSLVVVGVRNVLPLMLAVREDVSMPLSCSPVPLSTNWDPVAENMIEELVAAPTAKPMS